MWSLEHQDPRNPKYSPYVRRCYRMWSRDHPEPKKKHGLGELTLIIRFFLKSLFNNLIFSLSIREKTNKNIL
jgi:hypothetical protein